MILFQMVQMLGCAHSVCKECFKGHFTNVIKAQSVKDFNCPACALPDTGNAGDMYFASFMALVSFLLLVGLVRTLHEEGLAGVLINQQGYCLYFTVT